ncbi:MAG: hypothetical protein NT062_03045, partial [Proteobacteria bacterium]|nr:hypothetical protein [Pseudomonadota bacterium]
MPTAPLAPILPLASASTRELTPQQLVSLPTRDLGLRPSRPATEDEPTGQVEIQRLTSPRKPARAVDPT